MTSTRSALAPTLLIAACVPLLSACPVPVGYTVTTSAPLVGSVARDDGSPAVNLDVALSTAWNDKGCTTPVGRTRTGVDGRFELEGTQKHYKTTWFVPNLDRAEPRFYLCTAVGDTMRPAYLGYGSLHESADRDSVSCVVWEWEASTRVSCSGRGEEAVVNGGRWEDGASRGGGFYRLLLTEQKTPVKGYRRDRPQDRPFVYVQWVEPRTGDAPTPYTVRATSLLEFDRSKVFAISHLLLWRRDGRWVATVEGYKHGFMDDFAHAELIYELGPPGQATLVAGP